jgi:IclR family transcriptional regulator, KDG regulon repressor
MADEPGRKTELDPKNYVASVEKALRLLELFSEKAPQLTLGEIVRLGGYSRTATYRLLGTLEHLEWVVRNGDRYQLGLKVFRVGSVAVNALRLRQEASQAISELAARFGETVYLLVPDGLRGVCLERIEGNSQVQIMVLDIGQSLPLHAGGGPLALMSYRQDLFDNLVALCPLKRPNGTIIRVEDLQAVREETTKRGYSRSMEDVTPGVGAFGAPVFDAHGRAIAAISIGGLAQTLQAREGELSQGLMASAREISGRLGYLAD